MFATKHWSTTLLFPALLILGLFNDALPTIQITVPNARLILNDELGRI
jgi:hypothetical protein